MIAYFNKKRNFSEINKLGYGSIREVEIYE